MVKTWALEPDSLTEGATAWVVLRAVLVVGRCVVMAFIITIISAVVWQQTFTKGERPEVS